jgi:hypothetical protein
MHAKQALIIYIHVNYCLRSRDETSFSVKPRQVLHCLFYQLVHTTRRKCHFHGFMTCLYLTLLYAMIREINQVNKENFLIGLMAVI